MFDIQRTLVFCSIQKIRKKKTKMLPQKSYKVPRVYFSYCSITLRWPKLLLPWQRKQAENTSCKTTWLSRAYVKTRPSSLEQILLGGMRWGGAETQLIITWKGVFFSLSLSSFLLKNLWIYLFLKLSINRNSSLTINWNWSSSMSIPRTCTLQKVQVIVYLSSK